MPFVEFIDIALVLAIVLGSIILFVTEKLPVDGVAFIVLISLLVTGLVSSNEILAGFSNKAVITVMAMFILSAGLQKTGIVRWIAGRLHGLAGKGKTRLNLVLSTVCGFFSAFISNTATVAVLLPVSISLSKERGISPSRILMPLSFAAQFGGVCTLIGTTTNLLVHSIAQENGLNGFSMFEFAKLGSICFVIGLVYMLLASKFLLNDRNIDASASDQYRLKDYIIEMEVMGESPLINQTGDSNDINDLGDGIRVLDIIRDGNMIWAPSATKIREGDVLLIRGDVDRVMEAEERLKLKDWAEGNLSDAHLQSHDVTIAEVLIPKGSNIIGKSLSQMDFYWRYHAAVLGVKRRGEVLRERVAHIKFKEGDTLLLQGHKADLEHIADERAFVMLQDLSTLKLRKRRAIMAVAIMAGVITAAATGVMPILTASLLGCAAMVLSRCLNMQEAYESLDMKVFLLLAGLIPLGTAMQSSGAAELIVTSSINALGDSSPHVALGLIYILTMLLTAFMSNAATAVLISPLALTMATNLGLNPTPFLIAVAFAASTCFITPVGYQTNTMVYGPGGYKYSDFLKIGAPLNLIFFIISIWLIPQFWNF